MSEMLRATPVATGHGPRGIDELNGSITPQNTQSDTATQVRRTAEDWRQITADDLGRAVEGIIAAGRHLQEAKDEVEHVSGHRCSNH